MLEQKTLKYYAVYCLALLQVISLLRAYFYWKQFGIDAFSYLSINDVVLASGWISLLVGLVMIAQYAIEMFFPFRGNDETPDYKGSFFWVVKFFFVFFVSIGVVVFVPVRYEDVVGPYFIVVVFYCCKSIYSSPVHTLLLPLFSNKSLSQCCVSVFCVGAFLAVPLAIWEGRSEFYRSEYNSYVVVEGRKRTSLPFVGSLGDYFIVRSRVGDGFLVIPSTSVEYVSY